MRERSRFVLATTARTAPPSPFRSAQSVRSQALGHLKAMAERNNDGKFAIYTANGIKPMVAILNEKSTSKSTGPGSGQGASYAVRLLKFLLSSGAGTWCNAYARRIPPVTQAFVSSVRARLVGAVPLLASPAGHPVAIGRSSRRRWSR